MALSDATDRFYAELWPHRAAVLRVAQALTHSDADAEDLTQDALLKAFNAIDQLEPGTNANAWLMTVLRNTHIDRVRARQAHEVSLDSLEVDPADEPAEDVAAWGNAVETLAQFSDQQIIDCLKALPRDIAWTLLLVDVQGMPDQEAGQVLNVPTGTIKSRLHRGRRMLREKLLEARNKSCRN